MTDSGYQVSGVAYEAAVKGRRDFREAYCQLRQLFDPTADEEKVIRELAAEQDLSPKAVMRQALRHYQLLCHRLKCGEIMTFSGDAQRARDFIGKPNNEA